MTVLQFRPIQVWPEGWDPAKTWRPVSPFTATYADTLVVLDRELAALDATDVVLQVHASERDCRLDGQLRANAAVAFPGVILGFTSRRHGPLSYPCDAYMRPNYGQGARAASWQHNVRAIALGLEALRKVERYGIAQRGEQYAGYRQIGSGIALGAAEFTWETASKYLRDAAGWHGEWDPAADREQIVVAFKMAARRHHPDAPGGNADVFRQVTAARDVLAG